MITYNHEKYIRQAINSVLMQEGEFDLELNIVNDDSNDQTDQIIKELIETNKSNVHINYINNQKNKGIVENFIFCLHQCKGEYIAFCEGDDYWNTNDKIEKQLKAITNNMAVMIVHKSQLISDYRNLKNTIIPDYPIENNIIQFKDILKLNKLKPCHTSSFFIKSSCIELDKLYTCIQGESFGDTPLIALVSTKGPILMLDEVLSTYRLHKNGFSNQTIEENLHVTESYVSIFTKMKSVIDIKYHTYIDKAIKTAYYKLATLYGVKEKREIAKKYFKLSLWENIYFFFHNFKSYVLLITYCYLNEPFYKWCIGKYRILKGKSV